MEKNIKKIHETAKSISELLLYIAKKNKEVFDPFCELEPSEIEELERETIEVFENYIQFTNINSSEECAEITQSMENENIEFNRWSANRLKMMEQRKGEAAHKFSLSYSYMTMPYDERLSALKEKLRLVLSCEETMKKSKVVLQNQIKQIEHIMERKQSERDKTIGKIRKDITVMEVMSLYNDLQSIQKVATCLGCGYNTVKRRIKEFHDKYRQN